MIGLYFILPTLLVILFSFLIIRAAAIALRMTGMDEKRARFQALSAFTGTGFTTKEAESMVNHPIRRRIASWLMILGNAGVVMVIVTATSSLVTSKGYHLPLNTVLLILGIYLIYKLATRKGLIRKWESFIENKFMKSQAFEEDITEDLLHLIEGYGLVRAMIKENSNLLGSSISELKLPDEGLLILGIERGDDWIPIPKAMEKINEGDKLVVYGSLKVLKNLFGGK